MWLCDYCGKQTKEPIMACDTCNGKLQVKKDILVKHQAHQIANAIKHIKKPRTGKAKYVKKIYS